MLNNLVLNLFRSVHLRLFGFTLAIAMIFFAVAGAVVWLDQVEDAEKSFIDAGQRRVEAMAAMVSGSRETLESMAARIAKQPDVLEVIFQTDKSKTIVQLTVPNPDNLPYQKFWVPVRYSSGNEGTLELHLANSAEPADYGQLVKLFAGMAALFAIVLFFLLNRMLLVPLVRLTRDARELANETELDAPLLLRMQGYAQLRELTEILNTMSRRVFDVKQQMQDKVSHANAALVSTVSQLQSRSAELRDRTQELEIALEAIRRMATTDSLTGVHNRRYFDERLGDAVARVQRSNQPLTVILFDIDKFKHINDTLGHGAGDVVLEELSRMIKARTRASDVFARLGGDEFAFIMENTHLHEAMKFGNVLLKSVAEHQFEYESQVIPVTLSIGVAQFEHPPRDEEIIYKVVDDALYDAKRNGRNQVAGYAFDAKGNRIASTPETPA